ncbi:hypothetical protein COMA1_60004 [Candidatus Nitrospira nitrosa]|uniref:Uncharacterized protein n=1 Tax=Candidatus Nitrospira nitrosa TaxID=1742972 RepID=A0A0S4LN44_9BACT|nr:hypothetical protein COMA1_60004 [Candidatus Nitrospira nitrosa]
MFTNPIGTPYTARSHTCLKRKAGGVTERPNVPVLKTGDGVTHPRVQISPPPPYFSRL